MKKFFILLITLTFILAGCSSTPSLIEETPASPEFTPEPTSLVLTPGTLTVAATSSFSPFCMVDDNGDIYGVERIVMEKIAEDLGLKLKVESLGSVPAVLQGLDNKSIDVAISMLAPTDERKELYAMSVPYYYINLVLYVRSEDYEKYDSMILLKDKKIGVESSEMHKEILENLVKPATAVPYSRFWELYDALLSKEIDGFVFSEYYANQAEYDKEKVVPSKIKLDSKVLPVVMYSHSRELMDEIDKIIAGGINNSTLEQYVVQYSKPITRTQE